MKQGDFNNLAKYYINRPGYSYELLEILLSKVKKNLNKIIIADIGAGTGKLTEQLINLNLNGYAVEPSHNMRNEGIRLLQKKSNIIWLEGTGEETNLKSNSVNWIFMASSFHWTDYKKSIPEFHRILKEKGYLTIIYNPRDLDKCKLNIEIEKKIKKLLPNIKRKSSGFKTYTQDLEKKILYKNYFQNIDYLERPHKLNMNKKRYMDLWRSVNDIQSQAGEKKWNKILETIENYISDLENIIVHYKTRSWTVQVNKH